MNNGLRPNGVTKMYAYQTTYGDFAIAQFTPRTKSQSIFGKIVKSPEALELYDRSYPDRRAAEAAKQQIEDIIAAMV